MQRTKSDWNFRGVRNPRTRHVQSDDGIVDTIKIHHSHFFACPLVCRCTFNIDNLLKDFGVKAAAAAKAAPVVGTFRVTLVKSPIGTQHSHRASVAGLGLRRLNQTVEGKAMAEAIQNAASEGNVDDLIRRLQI